jgi:hypothetical protein
MHTGIWWGYLRGSDYVEDPGIDRIIILKWIFKGSDGDSRNVLVWLRSKTDAELL